MPSIRRSANASMRHAFPFGSASRVLALSSLLAAGWLRLTSDARTAAISLFTAIIGALSALASMALLLTTWRLARRSLVVRYRLALSGVVAILALTVLTDWPNETQAQFWRDHALLSGALTSLLLVGAGLILLDTKAERESAKRAGRVRQQVTEYVSKRANGFYLRMILDRLTPLGCRNKQLILIDGYFEAWDSDLRSALDRYGGACGEGADLLLGIADEESLKISEALLAARAAAHDLAETDATDLNFVGHVANFLNADARTSRLLQDPRSQQDDVNSRRARQRIWRRRTHVNRVRTLLGRAPLPNIRVGPRPGDITGAAAIWKNAGHGIRKLFIRLIEGVKQSDYLRPVPVTLDTSIRPTDVDDEKLIAWLMEMVSAGKDYEYRAIGVEPVLGLVDYMLFESDWDRDFGWDSADVNLLATRLGLAEPLPRDERLLNVPTANLAASGHNQIYEMPEGALGAWWNEAYTDSETDAVAAGPDDFKNFDPEWFV